MMKKGLIVLGGILGLVALYFIVDEIHIYNRRMKVEPFVVHLLNNSENANEILSSDSLVVSSRFLKEINNYEDYSLDCLYNYTNYEITYDEFYNEGGFWIIRLKVYDNDYIGQRWLDFEFIINENDIHKSSLSYFICKEYNYDFIKKKSKKKIVESNLVGGWVFTEINGTSFNGSGVFQFVFMKSSDVTIQTVESEYHRLANYTLSYDLKDSILFIGDDEYFISKLTNSELRLSRIKSSNMWGFKRIKEALPIQ